MQPVSIITHALQSIPPEVRRWILLVYAVVVALVGLLAILDVDLNYETIDTILLVIGGYLGVQSAANVPAVGEGQRVPQDPTPADPTIPEQRETPDG
jgi:hypothetical protein